MDRDIFHDCKRVLRHALPQLFRRTDFFSPAFKQICRSRNSVRYGDVKNEPPHPFVPEKFSNFLRGSVSLFRTSAYNLRKIIVIFVLRFLQVCPAKTVIFHETADGISQRDDRSGLPPFYLLSAMPRLAFAVGVGNILQNLLRDAQLFKAAAELFVGFEEPDDIYRIELDSAVRCPPVISEMGLYGTVFQNSEIAGIQPAAAFIPNCRAEDSFQFRRAELIIGN